MDTQTYLLLRFGDRSKLPSALEQIERLDGVARFTAVDGHFSLVVESGNGNKRVAEALTQLDGFAGLQKCDLVTIEKDGIPPDESLRYSFVFMEADKEGHEPILSTLKDHAQVDLLVRTSGDFNIVAKIHGKDFDEIDRLVADELGMLDGVLRLKSDRIIDLDNM